MRFPSGLFLLGGYLMATTVVGCQCNLNPYNFTQIPDAGTPKHDAGPAPPTFPLKAGDSLQYPALGGRTDDTCAGHSTPGDCQHAISAEYDITGVNFDKTSERWQVTANVTYIDPGGNLIDDAAMSPLVMEKTAPFASITENVPVQTAGAVLSTDAAADDQLTALGFPFFQFDSGDAKVFETTGAAFCARYATLDADASCKFANGAASMTVFYKDTQGGAGPMLHKVAPEYHNMGMVCGWDEGLIPYTDGITRDQNAFDGVGTPNLAAIFFQPTLTRDGVDYHCDCFSQQCSSGNGATKKCLSTDPDTAPGPCTAP